MSGNCPILTHNDYIHWMPCNITGCLDKPFQSNETYKYAVCFGDIENEDNNVHGNETSRSVDNVDPISTGIPLGIVGLLIMVMTIKIIIRVLKKRRKSKNGPSIIHRSDDGNVDYESEKLIKEPEYIHNGLHLLKTRNILYVIGQLGNSVSTSGKKIAKDYASRNNLSDKYYNYLEVSEKFSELSPETVFEHKSVTFIDGWGGLWNENPCEMQETLGTIAKVVEQSQTIEKKKFVIGLRTEIQEIFKDKLKELGIEMREKESLVLDSSSTYKREILKQKIKLLQKSCSSYGCECKSLNLEQVSGIDELPIGTFLVVELMDLDHTMIKDFLRKDVGPLVAMRNHFEGLMEGEKVWPWLPYFVCLGYYDKDEFRNELANEFNISEAMFMSYKSIDKYTKKIPIQKLAPMWSTRLKCDTRVENQYNNPKEVIVFRHNFLYICAFHACFKKYPKQMLRFCNLDAILQLVRTKDGPDRFSIEANIEEIDVFCEERLKNLANHNLLLKHPLILDWKYRNG